ncbi:MAG: hypothetical protein JHC84_17380 [Solirubrobacteraceae bacterium]|nr:hypothetical protein [Solirubrobacteraceae bacterium]
MVFSRLISATGRYELVHWTAARGLQTLRVGTRSIPFDADIGRDAAGRPVLTYSQCRTDGRLGGVFPTLDFTRARGCSLRFLVLTQTGTEALPRTLRLSGAAGLSLTTPSIRGRAVAAAASPARGSQNARVLYWRTPATPPIRLRGGTPPTCPYRSCETPPQSAVEALDLGTTSVAFLWRLTQPGYGAGPGTELRTSALRGGDGRQFTNAQGYVSGACGFRQPLSPTVGAGGRVSFLLAQSPCEEVQTTLASQAAARLAGIRPAGVLAYGAAWDGSTVYWLAGQPHEESDENFAIPIPCARPGVGCRLVVSQNVR